MQASSLSILVDEKRVNDLLKQKTGAKALLKSGCNLCVFIGFIMLFTVMALGEPLSTHRSLEAFLRFRFDTGAAVRLSEVHDINDFYRYWNYSVVPGLYSNYTRQYTFPGAAIPQMLKIDEDKANNRLFGLARVRMHKVKALEGCKIPEPYDEYFKKCYGPFATEAEDKAAFGPLSVIDGRAFLYTPKDADKSHTGWLGTYPGSGFTQIMYGNYTKTIETIDFCKREEWISESARALFIEFTIYNLNFGLYAVCRISFEISPSGGWLKNFDIDILDQRHLKPLGDGGLMAWVLLIMEATLVIFVVRYLCEEASEFIACDSGGGSKNPCKRVRIKMDYFTDGWNVIDWSNLLLMVVVMGYRMSNWGISGDKVLFIGSQLTEGQYTNLHDVVENVRLIRRLTAFNAVLTWFKAVKYINILPYILTFMETMAISWQMLFGWAAVFSTSFMGFCLSYCTAFGESISDFRTVPRAFVFLMRAFVGNADMRLVYDANPVIGSMLIVLFVVGMIFINMNLFYAILISYMSDARLQCEVEQDKEWGKFMDKIDGFCGSLSQFLQLKERFRGCFPGLYSRMKNWEKARMKLEEQRDEFVAEKERANKPHEDFEKNLGTANPNFARRKKREYRQSADADDDDDAKSVAESEPDLGPLRFKEQLEKQDDALHDFGHHALEDEQPKKEQTLPHPMAGMPGFHQEEEMPDRDEEAKELVLEATRHVVNTIKARCKGARHLVLAEMNDARQVLDGIGSVLEVLGRRARSLEAQQEQILPPELVARIKEEAENEDM